MPTSTAYGIVDKERRRRRKNRTQQEQLDDLNDRLLERAAVELTRLTNKPKLSGSEVNELRGWAKFSREIDRRKPTSNGQSRPDHKPEDTPPHSFIDSLAEQAAEAQDQPAQTPTSATEEPRNTSNHHAITESTRQAAQALLTGANGLPASTN